DTQADQLETMSMLGPLGTLEQTDIAARERIADRERMAAPVRLAAEARRERNGWPIRPSPARRIVGSITSLARRLTTGAAAWPGRHRAIRAGIGGVPADHLA